MTIENNKIITIIIIYFNFFFLLSHIFIDVIYVFIHNLYFKY